MKKKFYNKKEDPDVKLSKSLTYILRHGATKEGIPIGSDGYVKIFDLLLHRNFKNVTLDQIKNVVVNNDKKRFELEQREGDYYIRATQGHTLQNIEDEELLTKIQDATIFQQVIHGTYMKFWALIQAEGLKTMSRNHIHFAPGLPNEDQVISGMRSSCDIYIEIDMSQAIIDGIEFYLSSNNVILTRGINGVLPPKYFKKVLKKNGQVLFSNDAANEQLQQQQNQQQQQPKQQFQAFQTQQDEEQKIQLQNQVQNQQQQQQQQQVIQQQKYIQEYDYLLVLDFEAQCENNVKFDVQEIIEFPIVVIDVKSNKILEKEFHYYIKPNKHPILTQFCKDLTGIQQDWVDQGIALQDALKRVDQFLIEQNIKNSRFVFVTCGDWDLNSCLRNETKFKNIELEDYMLSWINIKRVFEKQFGNVRVGMVEMLKTLNIELVGRHHSGIDDARNIAQIALKLIKLGQTITSNDVKSYTQKISYNKK